MTTWIKCPDGTLVNPAYIEAIEPVKRPGSSPALRFRTPSLIRTLDDPKDIDKFLALIGLSKVEVIGE